MVKTETGGKTNTNEGITTISVNLDQAQIDTIQEKLLQAIDANPLEEAPPQFLYSRFAQGVFWITCANEPSKTWLT
jgi:hypothetical protein